MAALWQPALAMLLLALVVNGIVRLRGPNLAEPRAGDGRLARGGSATDPLPFDAMAGFVLPHGYPLEEHFATTPDGYILRLFRLGGRGAAGGASGRPVAFLQHPLMGSSVDYVVMGPGRSVAFMLVDAGYEVWLTNVRGNRFSRNHTHLDPDDPRDAASFWGFSWDQHAALDLPTALDYAAATSGQERMVFVGYSQGTTIGLAALASQPRVAARLTAAALLAPVAFVTGMSSPLFRIMVTWRFDRLFRWAGMREYGRHIPRLAEAAAAFCGRHPAPCEAYLYAMCGANPRGNLDRALLPDVMRFLPSGTSVQNMAHWGQLVAATDASSLTAYDYGSTCAAAAATPAASATAFRFGAVAAAATPRPAAGPPPPSCNQEAYNSTAPPPYDLGAITTPLALFSGGHDSLADPGDVALLAAALRPRGAVRLHHIEPDYGHLDFGVGEDAADRIYPALLDFLLQHTPAAASAAAPRATAAAAAA